MKTLSLAQPYILAVLRRGGRFGSVIAFWLTLTYRNVALPRFLLMAVTVCVRSGVSNSPFVNRMSVLLAVR